MFYKQAIDRDDNKEVNENYCSN